MVRVLFPVPLGRVGRNEVQVGLHDRGGGGGAWEEGTVCSTNGHFSSETENLRSDRIESDRRTLKGK